MITTISRRFVAYVRRQLAPWQAHWLRQRLARAYPELDALRQRRAILSRQHRSTRHADAAIRRAMTERLTVEMWEAMMPISPGKMKLYPGGGTHSKEWKVFRASIIDRAGNRCEGTPQHPECRAENGKPRGANARPIPRPDQAPEDDASPRGPHLPRPQRHLLQLPPADSRWAGVVYRASCSGCARRLR